MEKDTSNNITSELLVAYFRNEATEDQDRILESWVSESSANRQKLAELKLIWVDTGSVRVNELDTTKSYDIDKAWAKVKSTTRASSTGFFYLTLRRLAMAATVVFSLVAWYIFLNNQPIEKIAQAQNEVIEQILPDSSTITLNKNSQLAYLEEFTENERRVKLKGQAFFDVKPNKQKPFVIEAASTVVKVVGTSFDVKVDEKKVTVMVESGEVLFGKDNKMLSLKPGEKAEFDLITQELAFFTEVSTNGKEQFWRTKSLNFDGQSLFSIVKTLKEVYKTEIILETDAIKSCRLNVSFENDSIENIMEIISLALGLEVTYQPDSITLTGTGCQQE
ncbi:MAG: FecR domain-containing protein [Cyclobacteriaceae bacterium]